MLLDLFLLPKSRIARCEEKILLDFRLKVDKHGDQNKKRDRDRDHLPVRARFEKLLQQLRLHCLTTPLLYRRSMASFGQMFAEILNDFYRTLRQRLHKGAAVRLGDDAV